MDSSKRWIVPASGTLPMVLVAALAMGCGVSKAKYMDVTKSRDDLVAQTQLLRDSLDAVNQEKAQLAESKAATEARVKEVEAMAQQLGTELEQQKKAAEELKGTYESLVGRLQSEVSSGKIEIQQVRDGISLNLAQDILFPSGSANLDKAGRELLLKVSEDLKASPFQVVVVGHTDNQKIGPTLASRYPTNWELGAARSSRIVRLFEEAGITKDRLAAVSFSDSRPRMPNETPEGRAKNRRIEIRLRPTESQQVGQ